MTRRFKKHATPARADWFVNQPLRARRCAAVRAAWRVRQDATSLGAFWSAGLLAGTPTAIDTDLTTPISRYYGNEAQGLVPSRRRGRDGRLFRVHVVSVTVLSDRESG